MMAWIGWLLGASAIPTSPVVWAGGGMVAAVGLTAALLATLAVLAWQREPAHASAAGKRGDVACTVREDSPLRSAA